MVRNFLGQWKDKMLLPGSVAVLGRQGNMLSPAYGQTKMLQDWTICLWSQVMSLARIKNQMFLANPGNHYPSSSWDHQGKCQSFLEMRAGTARPQAEQHGTRGSFTYWATCSFFLPHCDMGYLLHRVSDRVYQGREGCLLPRRKMQCRFSVNFSRVFWNEPQKWIETCTDVLLSPSSAIFF